MADFCTSFGCFPVSRDVWRSGVQFSVTCAARVAVRRGGGGGVCGGAGHHTGQGAGAGQQRRWTFVILCCGEPAAILIY